MTSQPSTFSQIESELESFESIVDVIHYINPINSAIEHKKFFADTNYNPQFIYQTDVTVDQLDKLLEKLEMIQIPKTAEFLLLRQQKRAVKLRIELMRSRGTQKFTDCSIRLFGRPDTKLLTRAKNQLKRKYTPTKRKEYEQKEVIRQFKMAFITYGISWDIKTKDMPAAAAVIPNERTLYLRKGKKFSAHAIKQLIVHEIGTHILRVENGKRQPYKILAHGLAGYLPTEEGLALYNQEIHQCMSERLLRMYAGRVLAVDYAVEHSFAQTYEFLRKWFSKNDAWRLTLRAKRGLTDTSQPGSFTKDMVYLQGYYLVKEFIRKGGNYSDLYIGKIGIQHIAAVKRLKYIKDPSILPLYRYFGYFVHLLKETGKLPLRLLKTVLTR